MHALLLEAYLLSLLSSKHSLKSNKPLFRFMYLFCAFKIILTEINCNSLITGRFCTNFETVNFENLVVSLLWFRMLRNSSKTFEFVLHDFQIRYEFYGFTVFASKIFCCHQSSVVWAFFAAFISQEHISSVCWLSLHCYTFIDESVSSMRIF